LRPPRHAVLRFASALALLAATLAPPASAETPPAVGLTLDGMTYVLSHGDAVDLVVEAHRAEASPRSGRIELAGVRARITSPRTAGREAGSLELVCERGELDLETREFVASGRVAGRMQDGRILETERLRYGHADGVVSSDSPVSLRDEAGEYRGGGFQYWVRDDRFRLTGGARIVQGE
jgi:LPS export ABC transporter protein LptC